MSKGSMLDVIVIGVSLLVLSFGIVIAMVVMNAVNTSMSPMLPAAGQAALAQGVATVGTFNYGFVIIAVGMGIGSLIFAWLVPTHPIFIIISVILLMISMVILPALSNSYEALITDSAMASSAASFPLMNLMMSNLPIVGAVFGILMIIVLYTRYQSSQGQA